MKIVYYTSGITGSGRIVRGISIGNALQRKSIRYEYNILNSSSFIFLADSFIIPHIEIPIEDEATLSKKNYVNSSLFKTITAYNPDILIVDLVWFPLHNFINELDCKKIFLSRQVNDIFFNIKHPDGDLIFNPDDYDSILAIEPFRSSIKMDMINPIIIRNKDEILQRDIAIQKLSLNQDKNVCLIYCNGEPGEYEFIKEKYSYLEKEDYQVVYSTNYDKDTGTFPLVDYFNAVDLLICSGGYNSFWEAVYFNKEAFFEPFHRNLESQERRIKECQEYYFKENGADQLVDIMMNL